jgi:hypothetical protein
MIIYNLIHQKSKQCDRPSKKQTNQRSPTHPYKQRSPTLKNQSISDQLFILKKQRSPLKKQTAIA